MSWLFNYTLFNPRNSCGEGWTTYLQVTHQLSDLVTFLCYITIPILIYTLVSEIYKRTNFKYTVLAIDCFLFILFCGFSHLIGFLMFKYPMYRLDAAIKVCMAIVSTKTCYSLAVYLPKLIEDITNKQEIPVEQLIKNLTDKKDKAFDEVNSLVKKVKDGE